MNISLIKQIFKTVLNIEITRVKEYKVSAICELFTNIGYLAINLIFWRTLFYIGYDVNGWSYSDTIVFIAFSELFFGLHSSMFATLSRFWIYIVTGNLDIYLVRPFDPRIRMFLFNIKFVGLAKSVILFIGLLIYSENEISILTVFIGILICLIGLIIFSLIQLSIAYFSFYFGKVEAINEITDSLTIVNKYPTTILPEFLQTLFKTILPFYFFSTFSAEVVTNKLVAISNIKAFIMMLVCLTLWIITHNFLWKRGMECYESYNG